MFETKKTKQNVFVLLAGKKGKKKVLKTCASVWHA